MLGVDARQGAAEPYHVVDREPGDRSVLDLNASRWVGQLVEAPLGVGIQGSLVCGLHPLLRVPDHAPTVRNGVWGSRVGVVDAGGQRGRGPVSLPGHYHPVGDLPDVVVPSEVALVDRISSIQELIDRWAVGREYVGLSDQDSIEVHV